jgi:hypothetical protein
MFVQNCHFEFTKKYFCWVCRLISQTFKDIVSLLWDFNVGFQRYSFECNIYTFIQLQNILSSPVKILLFPNFSLGILVTLIMDSFAKSHVCFAFSYIFILFSLLIFKFIFHVLFSSSVFPVVICCQKPHF